MCRIRNLPPTLFYIRIKKVKILPAQFYQIKLSRRERKLFIRNSKLQIQRFKDFGGDIKHPQGELLFHAQKTL